MEHAADSAVSEGLGSVKLNRPARETNVSLLDAFWFLQQTSIVMIA